MGSPISVPWIHKPRVVFRGPPLKYQVVQIIFCIVQMSDKVKQYETENRNLEGSKTLLQSTVQALQQKEAALQHRLAEAGDLNEKLRVLQHQLQGSQQQENSIAASYKEVCRRMHHAMQRWGWESA